MHSTFPAPDGTRLAYRDEGQGKVLLCLAGLTRTMADFDYLKPHLNGVRMIRMDYRGRGKSGWNGPDSYTVLQEARDVLALMDHIGLARVSVLGTSRGGLIGMLLAQIAKPRLSALCLNDIGPQLEPSGLLRIKDYISRAPAAKNHADLAALLPGLMPGFVGVPPTRWREEAEKHYVQGPSGLSFTYDPALREAFHAAMAAPKADAWPLFSALDGLPLALIRGANSDILSAATAGQMLACRPDMIFAEVPDRGHIPFLDEPESLSAIHRFMDAVP